MYSIHGYAQMISDRGRTDAYAAALRRRITPESVILDLGAGPGILSLLACHCGARKVYAIETDDIIQVARECAETEKLAGQIEFIQENSERVILPEQVDGIVCDLHGALPLFDGSIAAILDARNRFLAHRGWIVPRRETIWVAAAACAASFEETIAIWTENPYGLDMTPARQRAVNHPHNHSQPDLVLVTAAACWTTLDYLTLTTPNTDGTVTLKVMRPDLAHGLIVWFDSELADGVELSCSPESTEKHVYGQLFFPWPEPIRLTLGDVVSVHLRATQVGSDYVWQWATTIRGQQGDIKAAFRQDTFSGRIITPERLRRRKNQYVPTLTEDGDMVLQILDLMRVKVPLEQIAKQIASTYPHRFANWHSAMGRVGELSAQYCL
jgi:protein arginine N-methyltransferase 1